MFNLLVYSIPYVLVFLWALFLVKIGLWIFGIPGAIVVAVLLLKR